MTQVILSQWVIASALGALCLGLLFFCLVPAVFIMGRMRRMNRAVGTMRAESAHLKDALEHLTDRQVEALARHQEQFGQRLAAALREPLDEVARSLAGPGTAQNELVAERLQQHLQQQMTAFADRLDQLLGGQVAQAKELQLTTLKSLETTIAAFQDMTKAVGATTEGVTQALMKELRAGISRSLAETEVNTADLIGKLGAQVSSAVTALEQQAIATGKLAVEQQKLLSEEAQRSMEALSAEVRAQTEAAEQVALSMRSVGTDVGHAVDRIIDGMTGLISGAAREIMRSGEGFAEIFEKSSVLSRDLTDTSAALAQSSQEISVVVSDYRNARETLKSMVELVRTTAESVRGDPSLTSEVVARLEGTAQKLIAAQGQADANLAKLNGALAEVRTAFGAQVLETARELQAAPSKRASPEQPAPPRPGPEQPAAARPAPEPAAPVRPAPEQPAPEETERRNSVFDRMISDWVQAPAQPRQPAQPPREERLVRASAPGSGRK
jgi:hypothetical protein